jgi:hypothetical protein
MESITTNKWLGRWLSGRILYIGDPLLLLDGKGSVSPVSADNIPSIRVAIIGKSHYFEIIKHFPFQKISEIKSAVLLDQNAYSPFPATRCMIRRIHQADDGATVNLWMLSPEAAGIIERQFISLAIPESALFSFYADRISQIYQVDQDGISLLTWVGQNGEVQSMRTNGDEPDLNAFRRAIGREGSGCPITRISGMENYAVFVSETIANLPLSGLYPFIVFHPDAIKLDYRTLKRALYATMAVYAVYLTLSLTIPYFVEKRLEKEDKEVSAQSIEWVEKQNEIESAIKRQKILADPINMYSSKYLLMTLLWKVLPAEAKITQMNISNTRVEIRGRAPSATDLLTALSGTTGVQNAQFISPVRKDAKSGQDTFMLGFEFTGKK